MPARAAGAVLAPAPPVLDTRGGGGGTPSAAVVSRSNIASLAFERRRAAAATALDSTNDANTSNVNTYSLTRGTLSSPRPSTRPSTPNGRFHVLLNVRQLFLIDTAVRAQARRRCWHGCVRGCCPPAASSFSGGACCASKRVGGRLHRGEVRIGAMKLGPRRHQRQSQPWQ